MRNYLQTRVLPWWPVIVATATFAFAAIVGATELRVHSTEDQKNITQVQTDLAGHEKRIDALESGQASIGSKLDSIKETTDRIWQRLER